MKLFTDIPLDEINRISSYTSGDQWNNAKERLADATTTLLHGAACLPDIHAQARAIYMQHSISDVPIDVLEQCSVTLKSSVEDVSLADLLVQCGLCESKNKAKTHIRNGAVRIDGVVEGVEMAKVACQVDGTIKLSLGKKKHVAVKFVT